MKIKESILSETYLKILDRINDEYGPRHTRSEKIQISDKISVFPASTIILVYKPYQERDYHIDEHYNGVRVRVIINSSTTSYLKRISFEDPQLLKDVFHLFKEIHELYKMNKDIYEMYKHFESKSR